MGRRRSRISRSFAGPVPRAPRPLLMLPLNESRNADHCWLYWRSACASGGSGVQLPRGPGRVWLPAGVGRGGRGGRWRRGGRGLDGGQEAGTRALLKDLDCIMQAIGDGTCNSVARQTIAQLADYSHVRVSLTRSPSLSLLSLPLLFPLFFPSSSPLPLFSPSLSPLLSPQSSAHTDAHVLASIDPSILPAKREEGSAQFPQGGVRRRRVERASSDEGFSVELLSGGAASNFPTSKSPRGECY